MLRGMTRPKSAEFIASQVGVGIGVALRRILSTLTLAQQVMRWVVDPYFLGSEHLHADEADARDDCGLASSC
ncbi:hypothetical protein GCM10009846_03930 [Agrococcus versicolor]|uniref:Uncharacterized protein n=1 Tax=Agrococcus versicolor TaxID=501482 RepID=A0ABN3AJW2_9MICO